MNTQSNPFTNGEKKMTKLKIEAVAVLNEDKQEFFTELMKKGVDAIKPEMDKQLNKMTNLEKAKELKERNTIIENVKLNTIDYLIHKSRIQKEAKDLKEKIENGGCGKDYCPSCKIYKKDEYSFKCGEWEKLKITNRTKKRIFCPKCLKAIKICEEILK